MNETFPRIALVIPAYQPSPALAALTAELAASFGKVILVDDGSSADSQEAAAVFTAAAAAGSNVVLLRHETNRGKGAALKTAFQYFLDHCPGSIGVVTADADGQHAAADIVAIAGELAAHPGSLCLGVRRFDTGPIPLRNKLGNQLSSLLTRVVLGRKLIDTQSGLRGIPSGFLRRLVRLHLNRYEFESAMILRAWHGRVPVRQFAIQTLYPDGNSMSHFRPVRDGLRVGYILFRFALVSLLTAAIDNAVFAGALHLGYSALVSLVLARLVAGTLNFWALRRAVFLADAGDRGILLRYVVTVAGFATLSHWLAVFIIGRGVMISKLAAESALFVFNFVVQRDFVFVSAGNDSTDWDAYYQAVPWTARLTRMYTQRVLCLALAPANPQSIWELGGANSCFIDTILEKIRPATYHVADSNAYGLQLLKDRFAQDPRVQAELVDLNAATPAAGLADAVFSVGLIEHFDPAGTRRLVARHFDLARDGGLVVITFPTPTWLYRTVRRLLEWANLWAFPDERPLRSDEVLAAASSRGVLVSSQILWQLILTQQLLVYRKT